MSGIVSSPGFRLIIKWLIPVLGLTESSRDFFRSGGNVKRRSSTKYLIQFLMYAPWLTNRMLASSVTSLLSGESGVRMPSWLAKGVRSKFTILSLPAAPSPDWSVALAPSNTRWQRNSKNSLARALTW